MDSIIDTKIIIENYFIGEEFFSVDFDAVIDLAKDHDIDNFKIIINFKQHLLLGDQVFVFYAVQKLSYKDFVENHYKIRTSLKSMLRWYVLQNKSCTYIPDENPDKNYKFVDKCATFFVQKITKQQLLKACEIDKPTLSIENIKKLQQIKACIPQN